MVTRQWTRYPGVGWLVHRLKERTIARAENIHKYTKGAYFPAGQLNENPQPIVDNWETTVEELGSMAIRVILTHGA